MNKYLVFAWAQAPRGGWYDFVAGFNTVSGAVKFIDLIHGVGPFKEPAEFAQIVDLIDKRVIAEFVRHENEREDGKAFGGWSNWQEVSED